MKDKPAKVIATELGKVVAKPEGKGRRKCDVLPNGKFLLHFKCLSNLMSCETYNPHNIKTALHNIPPHNIMN